MARTVLCPICKKNITGLEKYGYMDSPDGYRAHYTCVYDYGLLKYINTKNKSKI